MRFITFFFLLSCSSYQQFREYTEEYEVPSKVYKKDYDLVWMATLKVMQEFNIEEQNQETGVIKTNWSDNTFDFNFSTSFNPASTVKQSKIRVVIKVNPLFSTKTSNQTKVFVVAKQISTQDFLHGWRTIPSDGSFEKTILYRIARTIRLEEKTKAVLEKKNREEEESFESQTI